MDARFWARFTLVVFGGAAAGLATGAVGRYVFGLNWNIFAAASWGIMAGAVGLTFFHASAREGQRRSDQS